MISFNKARVILFTIIFTSLIPFWSSSYGQDQARVRALTFFTEDLSKKSAQVQEPVLAQKYFSPAGVSSPVMVFEREEGGFVILVKSDVEYVVAGYSPEGSFQPETAPEQLMALINSYEESGVMSAPSFKSLKSGKVVVGPLLTTNLGQAYLPEVSPCPSGCAATAMAQIVLHHQYPDKGEGAHCYTHPTFGELCVDFDEIDFNWPSVNSDDLQHYIAIAMEMNYCGASGSYPERPDYQYVLEEYLKYYMHSGWSDHDYWRYELDNGRPFYAGMDGLWAGHAVVIDGYDSDGYFHINFGWRGLGNGFYLLNGENLIGAGSDMYKSGLWGLAFVSPTPFKVTEKDSLSLVAIHNSFNGKTGWDLSRPVVQWPGVTVMNERVVRLHLGNFITDISGSLPPELGDLDALRTLIISADVENIPDEIGNLTSLEFFRIIGEVNGVLPSSITELASLKSFHIQKGQGNLTGELPHDIGKLANLEELLLTNILEGSIPADIGNLPNLKYIDFTDCHLTGEIPSSMGNLVNLKSLRLSDNMLTGSIPFSAGGLSNLEYLDLSGNQLSGDLPSSLGTLSQLRQLRLQDNQFTGELPESMNWAALENLQLQNNHFEGEIPASIGNSVNLKGLTLQNNRFTGIPNETGRLRNLTIIDLSHNQLTALPDSIVNIPGITHFNASNNEISYLPINFGAWKELKEIDLSYNQIEHFPHELCYLLSLTNVNLSFNRISSLPAAISMMVPVNLFRIHENEISGMVPDNLMNAPTAHLSIAQNRLSFEDIPEAETLVHGFGSQKTGRLHTHEIKAKYGDTLRIDIRDISDFEHPGNQYYWFTYPEHERSRSKQELGGAKKNPVLTLHVNEETLNSRFYCKIINDDIPTYNIIDHWGTRTSPVIPFLNTDTLMITLYTEKEILEKNHPESFVVYSDELHSGQVFDNQVTILAPSDVRGEMVWQGSADSIHWFDITDGIEQEVIKANLVEYDNEKLVLYARNPVYYRSMIIDGTCDPLYSDPIRVRPLGNIIFDEMVNVADEPLTVSVDSIEVILPAGLTTEDFRLTITKLNEPPPAPEAYRISSVYDVSVSFGSVFDIPLKIRLKNIDISDIDHLDLPGYSAAWYDDKAQAWVPYEEGGISLIDSCVVFYTPHLTKLSWYELRHGSYTHRFSKGRVDVIFKGEADIDFLNDYARNYRNSGLQSWHSPDTDPATGAPLMIQDMAEFMNQVITGFDSAGLKLYRPRFTVYASKSNNGAYGHISPGGYLRGYFTLNVLYMSDPSTLKNTLAHEYMHFMQQYYMAVMTANTFWTEANAPLAARLVWNENELKIPEPEANLQEALKIKSDSKSIYELLAQSWDAATFLPVLEKFTADPGDANVSSSFLHYMAQYREGTKLSPVQMLKDLWSLSSLSSVTWRNYLNDQVVKQLESTAGKEYDAFVRFMLEGTREHLTLLNKGVGNPLSRVIASAGTDNSGTFARNVVYEFKKDEHSPVEESFKMTVPYLASKMVVLNNRTIDRAVVVNYTREHEPGEDFGVYYGWYDPDNKIMVMQDISDSAKFSVLMEPPLNKTKEDYTNYGFLLFINRKCPPMISIQNNFNPSFTLKATPVMNIMNLGDFRITSSYIHNYDDGIKKLYIITGKLGLPSIPKVLFTSSNYRTSKTMLGDSAYVVTTSWIEHFTHDNGPNHPASIFNSTKEQTIIYNYLNGSMAIEQIHDRTDRWGGYYEAQPKSDVYNPPYDWMNRKEIQRVKLRNLGAFEPKDYPGYLGNVLEFISSGTAETMDILEDIYHTFTETIYTKEGEVHSHKTTQYVSTDFSSPDVKLEILLHYK